MNIDRPLDEIVSEARALRKKNARSNRRKKGPKKGGPDNKDAATKGNAKSDMEVDTPPKDSPKVAGGIKKKRRSRGGGGANARVAVEVVRKQGKKAQNQPRNASDRNSPEAPASSKRASKGAKVSVSNLDHGVTQSDISELFETVGPLKSARLIVLPDSRSSGSAEVVFEAMEDALEAIKRYNNVPLDNRPLRITLSTESAPIRIRGGRRAAARWLLMATVTAVVGVAAEARITAVSAKSAISTTWTPMMMVTALPITAVVVMDPGVEGGAAMAAVTTVGRRGRVITRIRIEFLVIVTDAGLPVCAHAWVVFLLRDIVCFRAAVRVLMLLLSPSKSLLCSCFVMFPLHPSQASLASRGARNWRGTSSHGWLALSY